MSGEQTLQDLRERVMTAHRDQRPLCLRGGGSKDFYGERLDGPGEILDLRPYQGIIDYEPSELVVTARCGTPLAELEDLLARHGQFLAFEPPHFGGQATLGGVIAAGLSGPRRFTAGAARDFVLGAKLLTATGEILSFGGRVMKNVAGFDVSRLLCGSLGFLGVITEVSLKVLPLPRVETTLRFKMAQREAVEAFNRWAGQPLPLSGAAWTEDTAMLRLSGAAPAVQTAVEKLGGERVEADAASRWWESLRHGSHPVFADNSLWRVSVPSSTAPLNIDAAPGTLLIDWGGALRWYGGTQADGADRGIKIRNLASIAGGTAACWKGSAPQGRFHPLQSTVAAIHGKLKDRFDPHGIFNPGRLLEDL